jgi:hypothetical protein
MGVYGWQFLDMTRPIRTLTGHAERYEFNGPDTKLGITHDGDGDWSLHVVPDPADPESMHLLRNPLMDTNGNNKGGTVECEVRPVPRIEPTPGSQSRSVTLEDYFDDIVGKFVKVTGPWVADASHPWSGGDCDFGCPEKGKTEIHPILSIDAELDPPNSLVRKHEIFVFSDNSESDMLAMRGLNFPAGFRIPLPAPPTYATSGAYRLDVVVDLAKSRTFSIVSDAEGNYFLEAVVESGVKEDGQGFYNAIVYTGWRSRSVRESFPASGDITKGLRSFDPRLFAGGASLRAVMDLPPSFPLK